MIDDPTMEEIEILKEVLEKGTDYLIHSERYYFYYPSDNKFKGACIEPLKSAEFKLRMRYINGEITSEEYTEKMSRL